VAADTNLQVVIGAEYKTDLGDVIGVFLRQEIQSRLALEVVAEIHAQGGVAVLPHPFQAHPESQDLWRAVDAMEVFNARCTESQNLAANELAIRFGKPMLAGSDAHFAGEITNVLMRFAHDSTLVGADVVSRDRRWVGRSTRPELVRASQTVKGVKRRAPRLIALAGLATVKHTARTLLGRAQSHETSGQWPVSNS
jgi:hypothetical protein